MITQLNEDKKKILMVENYGFAEDVEKGLSATPKKLSSKYFYDDLGSKIFQEITRLDDYYLTRSELEILNDIKGTLPEIIGEKEVDIIELGVGDGHKTKIIIDSFLEKKIKVNFLPIDISLEALHLLENNISASKNLNIHAIAAEYIAGINFARKLSKNRLIVLFLGSNIGNFTKDESISILQAIKSVLNKNDYILIGFDLKKDIQVLTKAYSDEMGVTAKFNLNLLLRINTELGGNFDVSQFKHLAFYNPELGAMESFLISLKDQNVFLSKINKEFHFEAFEPIHLEYSFKFLEKDIQAMSKTSGFKFIGNFSDHNKFFVDSLWQV